MSTRHPTTEDDTYIPRPVWLAQQLGWCSGPQGMWSWNRLLDAAESRFYAEKAERIRGAA